MRSSTAIGTIVPSNPKKLYKEINGEKFYNIEVVMDDIAYPAVISEYLLQGQGKYEIKYYLRTEDWKEKLYTFINILSVDKVDESTPDRNEVEVYGNISKVFPMKVRLSGAVAMKMVGVRYQSSDKNINIAHCIGYDNIARKFNQMNKGDNVLLVGKLRCHTSIEVEVEIIPVHNPKRETVELR